MASTLGGYQLVGSLAGGVDSVPVETALVVAGDATALFVGDVVVSATSGATADVLTGRRVVTAAGAGTAILGVVVGVLPLENAPNVSMTKMHRAASTAQYVQIVTDKNALFRVATDGTTLTSTKGVGLNCDLGVGAGGNTLTGASTYVLHDALINTTSTLQFRIRGYDQSADNNLPVPTTGVAGTVVLVSINNSELVAGATATASSS